MRLKRKVSLLPADLMEAPFSIVPLKRVRGIETSPMRHAMIPFFSGGRWMPYFDVDPLLEAMLDAAPGISDLNLPVGRPPQVEVAGELRPVSSAAIGRRRPCPANLLPLRRSAAQR